MSINQKQFDYLQEMNIPLWQRRNLPQKNQSAQTKNSPLKPSITIDLEALLSTKIFRDIIAALALSADKVALQSETILSWEKFSWTFNNDSEITYVDNVLSSPEIRNIIQQPALKKQLYITLQQHQLLA